MRKLSIVASSRDVGLPDQRYIYLFGFNLPRWVLAVYTGDTVYRYCKGYVLHMGIPRIEMDLGRDRESNVYPIRLYIVNEYISVHKTGLIYSMGRPTDCYTHCLLVTLPMRILPSSRGVSPIKRGGKWLIE